MSNSKQGDMEQLIVALNKKLDGIINSSTLETQQLREISEAQGIPIRDLNTQVSTENLALVPSLVRLIKIFGTIQSLKNKITNKSDKSGVAQLANNYGKV